MVEKFDALTELIDTEATKDRKDGDGEGRRGVRPNSSAFLGRAMTDDEFQGLVYIWACDAREYIEEFLSQDRYEATLYYRGKLPDVDVEDAQEDRSRAVLTEVRDTVLGIMPDLLRIFFSSDGVVKYLPTPTESPGEFSLREQQANQATAFVRDVVLKVDNPDFFMDMHSVFQDGLVRKNGIVRWNWEESTKPQYSRHTGLPEDMALALASDDDVEIVGSREYPGPPDLMTGQPATFYDLEIKRSVKKGRLRVRGIPCEQVMIARRGTAIDRTTLFGYSEDKKVGEFLAEGWIDDIHELDDCDLDVYDDDNWETQARRPKIATMVGPADDPPEDPTQRIVKFAELYMTADRDGDGIAELLKVITGGIRYKVLHVEPVDDINYAAFCPYPEAFQFFGDSVADLTKDIQRIKSRILRDTLDSLAQSITPQTAVVEGQVNLDDVLNPDTSKIIRMRQPGMVQPITTPFVGADALPVLEMMTKVRENRTGQSDAAAGLNADALQSATEGAVNNTLSKAQSRVEMIARIFAETGMKRLFRGILREIVRHMDKPRTVLLTGNFVEVDPRQWVAEMDVETTLVLGRGSQAEQIVALEKILAKQEQILMNLGFNNPLVTIDQYSHTLQMLVELAGWRNSTSFFNDTSRMNPQQKQAMIQAATQAMQAKAGAGKGDNPQIEQMKLQSAERIEQMKGQIDVMKAHGQMQLEALKAKANVQLELLKIRAQAKSEAEKAHINALVDHTGNLIDAHVDHHANLMGNATKLAIAKMQPAPGDGSDS